jgi:hypothetical protein
LKHKLLTLATASVLTACSSPDQSNTITVLKSENLILKQRLAALGQDTTDVLTKSLVTKSGTSDTTVTTSPIASTTGSMWMVKHYVDEFGAKTKSGFVGNAEPIVGTFSNSATQDSDLIVMLLIDKDLTMAIKLFEYAHNNPVKAYGNDNYQVNVKDKDGKAYHLSATNYETDRLTFDKPSAKQLHEILLKGGRVQFVIRETDTPTTVYNFTIDNAAGYLDARKELKKG